MFKAHTYLSVPGGAQYEAQHHPRKSNCCSSNGMTIRSPIDKLMFPETSLTMSTRFHFPQELSCLRTTSLGDSDFRSGVHNKEGTVIL
jgi:hypothetical protein